MQYFLQLKYILIQSNKFLKRFLGNGRIPEAPKLPGKQAPSQKITKFPKALISKSAGSKTQNPPQLPAMSAREELMMAIRGKGGVQGLRKVKRAIRIYQDLPLSP